MYLFSTILVRLRIQTIFYQILIYIAYSIPHLKFKESGHQPVFDRKSCSLFLAKIINLRLQTILYTLTSCKTYLPSNFKMLRNRAASDPKSCSLYLTNLRTHLHLVLQGSYKGLKPKFSYYIHRTMSGLKTL